MLKPTDVYRLDLNSRWLGVPTELLMENAGKNVADVILERYPDRRRIVVVCSKTNNGGDGLVAARHLSARKKVDVVFIGRPEHIRAKETRLNWEIITRMQSIKLHVLKTHEDLTILDDVLRDADVVVDAIFGVGIKGEPRGLEGMAIREINRLKAKYNFKIVSIDVPSGFDCYRGVKTETMVASDLVVTFHDMKNGLDRLDVDVVVRGIGIPPEADMFVGPGDLLEFLKPRKPTAHKGDFGRILIIGGSKYYSGAPALVSLAALKTGADLSIIYAPEEIANSIRSISPNLIVWSYKGATLTTEAVSEILDKAKRFDVIVVGPGLGVEEETLLAAHQLIEDASRGKPIIVDADGIKAIAKFGIPPGDLIVTPHAGEFRLLTGISLPDNIFERGDIIMNIAQKHKITILLKGHVDIISDGLNIKYNRTGNPGMTVGGTGDVLAGIVASIRACGFRSFDSACIGAFICGLSGDLALRDHDYGLTATDVIDYIPKALRHIRDFIWG